MKNLLLSLALIIPLSFASAQSNWNIGVGTGCVTNIAMYESGDETANAIFHNNFYKSGNFAVNFRYKISEKFSLQTGFNFTEFGFSYKLDKDYSLVNFKGCEEDEADVNSSTCISSIPSMIIFNTPKNCMNTRFIFGAGFTVRAIDKNWESSSQDEVPMDETGNAKLTYMTEDSRTIAPVSAAFTWMIGIEKLLRRNNSITFTFEGNQGFNKIAESTVNYTVNNQEYTHTFINRGSYVNFVFAYNFSPFGTRKANKMLKDVVK